ncbi:MAG: hypothetical protein L3J78_02790 [Thermoplasmata archaeon]|nr:hypothetical protein [Thermoplasmata archaeon]
MPRAIKTGLEFEAAFAVKGRILQAIMCECEAEGELRIRVARDPKKGWSYDPKDAGSFVDIHAYDPRDAYTKVRAGEWVDGRVVCYGNLKRVRARRIEIVGSVLASGTRLIGAVRVDGAVEIDFGLFQTRLGFEDEGQRRKVLNRAGLKDGSFVATDVGVDLELKRWGARETILRKA